MLFFRRRTIFHVEEALPDPEELKLRFRRRVLLLTLLGSLVVLSIPVARDLQADLFAHREARHFAHKLLETRLLASVNRVPVSLSLSADGHSWRRTFHGPGENCLAPAPGPEETWPSEIHWRLRVQKEDGQTLDGATLCLHPRLGLLLDTVAADSGKVLVTALSAGESHKEAAYLLVSQFGSDLQLVMR